MGNLSERTFQEVFDDHLRLSEAGDFENDLKRNYSEDLVVLMENKIYHGHEGARILAKRLENELPHGKYENKMILLDKEVGMLEWSAESEENQVTDGVDSYLFRDGKIVAQTIHYTVEQKQRRASPRRQPPAP